MFTGIVECKGKVAAARSLAGGLRLSIQPEFPTSQLRPGDSIAVNGVCLTVAAISTKTLDFDVIRKTLSTSNLGRLRPGGAVNLERSLQVGNRLDGHWVQGHIDATTPVTGKIATANEWVLWLRLSEPLRYYIVPKGSVALDGVSLTVADVLPDQFSVALIPTTLQRTTLGERQVGDQVNVETDLIVRTVVHNLTHLAAGEGMTEKLKAAGFDAE